MLVGQPPQAVPDMGCWAKLVKGTADKVELHFAPMYANGDKPDDDEYGPGEMGPGTTETWFDTEAQANAFLANVKTHGYEDAFTALCKDRGCDI